MTETNLLLVRGLEGILVNLSFGPLPRFKLRGKEVKHRRFIVVVDEGTRIQLIG